MQRATIWGREVCMQGSPVTLLYYQSEFGSDLAGDLTNAFNGSTFAVEPFLRIAWAMAKTHESHVSDYKQWLREFPEDKFTLSAPTLEVISSAINAELFRGNKTEKKFKHRVARLLGHLSRYFSRQEARLYSL